MAIAELSSYNLSELKGLHYDLEQEIKSRRQYDLELARKEILDIATHAGISVEELISDNRKPNKGMISKVAAKYENPDDKTQTWTGRGRQPKWIVAAIQGGKQLMDFRI